MTRVVLPSLQTAQALFESTCPTCERDFRTMTTRETHRCSGGVLPPATEWIVAEGEAVRAWPWPHHLVGDTPGGPPSWTVEASRPCQTCGGTGRYCRNTHDDWCSSSHRCEACGGSGRPRVAIWARTPCVHVDCRGVGDYHCWACHGKGHGETLVGTVTVTEVLPILEADAYTPECIAVFKDGEHVDPGEHVMHHHHGTWTDLSAQFASYDTTTLPGKWAAKVSDPRRAE